MIIQSIIWKRLDQPGHEFCQLISKPDGWNLAGSAIFLEGEKKCRLEYEIDCDLGWRTQRTIVDGWIGDHPVNVEIAFDGAWSFNQQKRPDLATCVDIDLNFSPSTNLLPIRRLGLVIGQEARVEAAWLRFPSFHLEPFRQVYRRQSVDVYRYESEDGQFTADLKVNADGFVIEYPNLWQVEKIA